MTSTIETQLLTNRSLCDVFQALFPCGSITGAPKIATMEIIKRVENNLEVFIVGPLESWCHRDLVFSTQPFGHYKWKKPRLSMVSEGGLPGTVTGNPNTKKPSKSCCSIPSEPKILSHFYRSYSSRKTSLSGGAYKTFTREQPILRLSFNAEKAHYQATALCQSLDFDTDYRLKLSFKKDGELKFEHSQLTNLSDDFYQARLVEQRYPLDSPYTFFKTSYRPHLSIEPHEQIYYNHEGQLLETSIGNIVLKIEDQLYTPPVHLGLLNGIYRQSLIAENKLKEKVLTVKDLKQAQTIYGCNAVRGLYELKVEK